MSCGSQDKELVFEKLNVLEEIGKDGVISILLQKMTYQPHLGYFKLITKDLHFIPLTKEVLESLSKDMLMKILEMMQEEESFGFINYYRLAYLNLSSILRGTVMTHTLTQ